MKKTKFTLAFLAVATLLFAAPAAQEYYDGVTQKFNPNNTRAGFNFGLNATDPTTLNNGDSWVNSTTHLAKIRLNGATVPFVTGSTSTGGNGATDAGKIVLFGGEGQITASASTSTAVNGVGSQYGGYFSGNTIGLLGDSDSGTGLRAQTTSGTTIASFYDDGAENTRFAVQRDGTLKFDNGAYTVHPPLASGVLLTADETDTPSDGQTPVWNAGAGKILWETPAAGTGAPGGADGQLQWNNSGVFDGIPGATTDGTNVVFASGNLRATVPYITTGLYDTNGGRMLGFTATGSALYGVELTNAASGGTVIIGTTTPTQSTAGIGGTPLLIRSSNAVAGLSTPGVTTGGTINITGGNGSAGVIGGVGADIILTSGNGGNGSTTNGSSGEVCIITGSTGAGAGAAGTVGSFVVKPNNTEVFRVNPSYGLLTKNNIGDTNVPAFVITNTTAATSGNQQRSGSLRFSAQGYKTNATAGSQEVLGDISLVPVQGASAPSSYLSFRAATGNGGTLQEGIRTYSNGSVAIGFEVGQAAPNPSGNYSIAGGGRTATASGTGSIALGSQSTASATGAVALGQSNTASATAAQARGTGALANRYGQDSFAAGIFAANGDAQRVVLVMRGKTTTNSPVELALDGAASMPTVASGKIMHGTLVVTGVKSDGSAYATYYREVAIINAGGTTTLIKSDASGSTDGASGTSLSVTANNTSDYLAVAPTGIAGETWRWLAVFTANEIAYGN